MVAPKDANGLDLFAMAAAIMGGTSFSGGIGTIGGAGSRDNDLTSLQKRIDSDGNEFLLAGYRNRSCHHFVHHYRLFETKSKPEFLISDANCFIY